MPVILLSLAAALAFAVAAVLQQHSAAAQPPERYLRPVLLLGLVQRPLWLLGIGASGVGTALQVLALWHGSLVTVQPLLVCGLLFALPINAIWMRRRRPGGRELLAAAVVCLGLVTLLVATDPRPGTGKGTPLGWAVSLGALLVAVSTVVVFSLRSRRASWRAGLLAAAGGLVNGLSAAFTKGVAREMAASWHAGPGATLLATAGNWELYAFGATLLLAMILVQSAFQSGPIRWSLPALTAANPIASVLLGSMLLGERIRSGPVAAAGAGLGLLLVVAGIMALSSSSLITGGAEEPAPAPGPEAAPAPGPEPALPAVPAVAGLPAVGALPAVAVTPMPVVGGGPVAGAPSMAGRGPAPG